MSAASRSGAEGPTARGTARGAEPQRRSPGEIEALARKAARGAGYGWGLAEEAGWAVRVLVLHGLPGAESLAGLLRRVDGLPYAALRPMSTHGEWRAEGALLCPIVAGAALGDRGAALLAGRSLTLGPTACPLLLAAFARRLADRPAGRLSAELAEGRPASGRADRLSVAPAARWQGVSLRFLPYGIAVEGDASCLRARRARRVSFDTGRAERAGTARLLRPEPVARAVDPIAWRTLERFASRTYAPATERSRAGAGADRPDRD